MIEGIRSTFDPGRELKLKQLAKKLKRTRLYFYMSVYYYASWKVSGINIDGVVSRTDL